MSGHQFTLSAKIRLPIASAMVLIGVIALVGFNRAIALLTGIDSWTQHSDSTERMLREVFVGIAVIPMTVVGCAAAVAYALFAMGICCSVGEALLQRLALALPAHVAREDIYQTAPACGFVMLAAGIVVLIAKIAGYLPFISAWDTLCAFVGLPLAACFAVMAIELANQADNRARRGCCR